MKKRSNPVIEYNSNPKCDFLANKNSGDLGKGESPDVKSSGDLGKGDCQISRLQETWVKETVRYQDFRRPGQINRINIRYQKISNNEEEHELTLGLPW